MTDRAASPTATIFDIAEAAGVSITTVSHVFSGNRPVGEETRRKVLDAAEQLHYHPRGSARALATGRTMTLALQISFSGPELLFNPFFTSLLPAMSEAAIGLGYSFVFVPADEAAESFVEPLITRRSIDGAILVDPRAGDGFVAELIAAGVPYVSLGRVLDGPEGPRVDHDSAHLCSMVIRHLREEGYERIDLLTLGGEISYLVDAAAAFARLEPKGRVVKAESLSARAGYAAALELLTGDRPPDAIFCMNDVLAVGVMQAAASADVGVPDQLGVVGVEDSLLAQHADPALSTVKAHPDEAGRLLIVTMDQLLEGQIEGPSLAVVPTELVVRRSSKRH